MISTHNLSLCSYRESKSKKIKNKLGGWDVENYGEDPKTHRKPIDSMGSILIDFKGIEYKYNCSYIFFLNSKSIDEYFNLNKSKIQ